MLIPMYCEVVLGVLYCVYSVVRCVCVCMCVCVCVRRRVCSVFGPSDELSWALQAHFCHSISSELHICSEKTKNCVFIAATY